jgi:hypothetical protein
MNFPIYPFSSESCWIRCQLNRCYQKGKLPQAEVGAPEDRSPFSQDGRIRAVAKAEKEPTALSENEKPLVSRDYAKILK